MQQIISVIVPVYQVDNYLGRCIESLLCQTYHNLEIFLVDDGSCDTCARISDAWAKKDDRRTGRFGHALSRPRGQRRGRHRTHGLKTESV